MSREGVLGYKSFLWLWLSTLAVVVMWVVYLLDEPVGGRNGGTVVGYTYGGIATAGILFLMWYGIRKRSYHARFTTLKGMLAAHVWIGVALIFIVPMHSGLSFGLNVHTLAYVLMCIVIVSGIWGAAMYTKLPLEIKSQRGGGTLKMLLEQINAISRDINQMAGIGGQEKAQKSDAFLAMLQKIDFQFRPSLLRSLLKRNPEMIDRKTTAAFLGQLPSDEHEEALKLIGLINKKRDLVCRLQDEARVLTWVRAWLFLHLPVSFALLAALAIHIFSVFYYW